MAFEGKNPNKESFIFNDKAAAGVPNAPTGKVRIINRSGSLFAQDDTGAEDLLASSSAATPDVAGIVTAFVPVVKSSVNATNVAYPILDGDGFSHIHVTTGATADMAVTLPTAADNEGREITVMKVDTGTGNILLVDDTDSALINGKASQDIFGHRSYMKVVSDGATWLIVDQAMTMTAYTATIVGFGTVTIQNLRWRRVAGQLEIQGDFNANATLDVNTAGTISLPNAYTIDNISSSDIKVGWLETNKTSTLALMMNLVAGDGDTSFGIAYRDGVANVGGMATGSFVDDMVNGGDNINLWGTVKVDEFN